MADNPSHLYRLANNRGILEPPPCDACWHADRCKVEQLACKTFSIFMAEESNIRWSVVNRMPTRERYDALLGAL